MIGEGLNSQLYRKTCLPSGRRMKNVSRIHSPYPMSHSSEREGYGSLDIVVTNWIWDL